MRQRILVFYLFCLATILLSLYNSAVFSQDHPLLFDEDLRYYTLSIDLLPPLTDIERLNIYEGIKSDGYFVYYTWEIIDSLNQRNIGVGRFSSISEAEEFAVTFREKENTEYNIEETRRAGKDELFYTLRIKTSSSMESREASSIVMNFINKGYFSFIYGSMLPLEQRMKMKLRVGMFDNVSGAGEFAKAFVIPEAGSINIDTAVVYVEEFENGTKYVTTPNGIWSIDGGNSRELFAFDEPGISNYFYMRNIITFDNTKANISPDGKAIVFWYNYKIIKVNTDDKEASILLEETPDTRFYLARSFPQWSPSGNYIAFLDNAEWETTTSLYLMKPDGTEVKRFVTGDYSDAVKYFLWHPAKDEIFFVAGFAMGTETVGGNLYSVDLDGNRKDIATAEAVKGEEILSAFRIFGNSLIYKVSHYSDEQKLRVNRFFTTHEIIIPDIK